MTDSEIADHLVEAALTPSRIVDPAALRRRARKRRRARRARQGGLLAGLLVAGVVGTIGAIDNAASPQLVDSADVPERTSPSPAPSSDVPASLMPDPETSTTTVDSLAPTSTPFAPPSTQSTPATDSADTNIETVSFTDPESDFQVSPNVLAVGQEQRPNEPNVDVVGGSISFLDARTIRFVVEVADLEPGDPPGSDGISISLSFTHHDPGQSDRDRSQGLLIQRTGDFESLRVYDGCDGCALQFHHVQNRIVADVPISVFQAELASGRYYSSDVPPVELTPTSVFWYFRIRTALAHTDAEPENCEDRERRIGCSTYYSESEADDVSFKGPYEVGRHLHGHAR